ncbi:MAG: ATP-binding cassette domain-containing protein [Spartobacteria bacterium]|nr:ATP-binding cassette domain-containing protein [Spartobacteria bacterium]
MIRFENVKKSLGGKVILDHVNFEIKDGETFVIVGGSGMGKSVTIKHMVRLLTPDEGRVYIDDDVVSEATGNELERIRSRFGLLFQGAALLQWLTVGDNVGLPLRMHTKMSREEIDAEVERVLKLVDLEGIFWKHPTDLSGGMQKRVGLARAIITKPKIVLYDEPTSGLDPVTSRTIDALIDDMRVKLGITSVVVTHDLHSALAIGSRIAMLYRGEIVELAPPEEFVKSNVPEVKSFLESDYITKRGRWEKESSS